MFGTLLYHEFASCVALRCRLVIRYFQSSGVVEYYLLYLREVVGFGKFVFGRCGLVVAARIGGLVSNCDLLLGGTRCL